MTSPSQTTIPTLHHLSSSQSLRILWALEEIQLADPSFKYILKKYARDEWRAPKNLRQVFPLGKGPILTVEDATAAGTTKTRSETAEGDQQKDWKINSEIYQITPGTLTESRLIAQFLSDNYAPRDNATGSSIWKPTDPTDIARDTFFQEFVNSTLAGKTSLAMLFQALPTRLPFGLRQMFGLLVTPLVNVFTADLHLIYKVLEDSLTAEGVVSAAGDADLAAEGEGKWGIKRRPWLSGEKIGLADINASWAMDAASQHGLFKGEKYPRVNAWYQRIQNRPAYRNALEKGGDYDLKSFK